MKEVKIKCQIPGCEREMYVKKHKLCKAHATQLYVTGMVNMGPIVERGPQKRHNPFKISNKIKRKP